MNWDSENGTDFGYCVIRFDDCNFCRDGGGNFCDGERR